MIDGGLLWQIAVGLVAAGVVYGGIRSDLREMHRRIDENTRAIEKAHERIDGCVSCPGRRAHERKAAHLKEWSGLGSVD